MGWIQSIFRPNKTADETVTADTEAVVNCEKTPNAPACQEGANPGATEDPTSVIMGWNRVLAGRDANPESEFDHEEPNKTTRAERLAAKRRAQDAIDPNPSSSSSSSASSSDTATSSDSDLEDYY